MGAKQDERYRRLIEELRSARLHARLSQAALAKRLNQRQQFVSKYEQLERRLDVVEFIDAAKVLGVDWKFSLEAMGGGGPFLSR